MELFTAQTLITVILFITLFFLFNLYRRRWRSSTTANFTVLKSYPIIGNIPHIIKNIHRLIDWSAELIPASPTATVTIEPLVFTANPAVVEHMLKTNFNNYPKSEFIVKAISDCFGRGLVSTNGEEWRVQRRAASYEFTTKSIRSFVHHIVSRKIRNGLLPLLHQVSRDNQVVDLQYTLECFAFDNICSLIFGRDLNCLDMDRRSEEGQRLFKAFDEGPHLSVVRAMQPFSIVWKIKRWLRIGMERRLLECVDDINNFVENALLSRREEMHNNCNIGRDDLLSRLMANEENTDQFIRDMIVGFVLAGRDTTPCALTWFFWLLNSNPLVVKNIREEIKQIRSRRQDCRMDQELVMFSLEELRDMNYLHAAISESLRLYPPVPLISRDCIEAEELPDGTKIKKGWNLLYNAMLMGRREELWGKDCSEFKPDRWIQNGMFEPRSPFLNPSFLGGPRMCIGKDMAFIQMKSVAAIILETFDIVVTEKRGEYQLSMVLRMVGGLPVKFKERKNNSGTFSC